MSYIREKSLEIKVVHAIAGLFVSGKPNGELDLERVNDRPRDFVLERERAVQLVVISFRPNAKTVSRVNQFSCHTNTVTLALQTSFKHIANIELLSNLACVCVLRLECK